MAVGGVESPEILGRPEFGEDGTGRGQLEDGRVLVAERSASEADQLARPRLLVGRAELLPVLERAA